MEPESVISPSETAEADKPLVWLITAYRAGEREQILALAEALGWPFKTMQIAHRKYAWRSNLLRGTGLSGIDTAASSPLQPPWPDLVISAGMRNEPVCRWVRQQSAGKTRIVHIGRPWADPGNFDLVITTPQYRLPQRPNVLQNATTLHRVTPERLLKARQQVESGIMDVSPPFITLIVGGNSGPYTLGRHAAKRLAGQASALAEQKGASLLVTTSSRTSTDVSRELKKSLRVPAQFYEWKKGDADNPYFGYLALADEIIVTGDSISMLSEACATRKPVHMFDPGAGKHRMRRQKPGQEEIPDFRLTAETYSWLMRFGPRRLSRDIRLVHDRLIAEGRAVWLGDPFPDTKLSELPDLQRAVQRVRQLFD